MTRPAPLAKECNTCGRILPINDFYKEKAAKDGHRNICKHCYIEKQSMKRAKDPDHKVKHRTKLKPVMTAEQREKKREYFRRYREANREKLNQYSRESNRRRRAGEEKRNRGPQKGVTLTKQPFTVPKAQPKPIVKEMQVRLCDTCAICPCIIGFENLETLGYCKCRNYKPRNNDKRIPNTN